MNMLSANRLHLVGSLFLFLSFACIAFCNYLIFMFVDNERVMGPVQRIFYFHVASATACYVAFAVVFFAALRYIANRDWRADCVAEAAAEVGFVFCTITLFSGMIWGHAAWNTWFSWEPRLVTFLLLWLIFLAFIILRMFASTARVATHSAVLGIVGALTVPLVVFSIKILPASSQLHPQVIEKKGLDPQFQMVMFICLASFLLFEVFLIWLRTRIGFLERRLRG